MNAAPRKFLAAFLAAAAAFALAAGALLLAIDPYDRGFGLFRKAGTLETVSRMANVSRARDPRFNAAIIGNSHVQLLSPARLRQATGLDFVQLTVQATGPREQNAMLAWWLANNSRPRAVILGADYHWCVSDPSFRTNQPFPYWLYDPSPGRYAASLFRFDALGAAFRRARYLMGLEQARPADGYSDYTTQGSRAPGAFAGTPGLVRAKDIFGRPGEHPGAAKLAEALGKLPGDSRVVVLAPPVWAGVLPEPGSAGAAAERSCIAALQKIVGTRPLTTLVDARNDTDATRNPGNFYDATHYGHDIAKALEAEIAAAFEAMR